ncbi:MAG: tetratricopeptide repeat protein, partial [Verrucomicrobiia bacterium]
VMVSAPIMALLYDRTFVSGTFREAWRRRWPLYLALAGTWIPLGYLVITTGSESGMRGFGTGFSSWRYALMQLRAIVLYLRLALWPHPLVVDYGPVLISGVVKIPPQALVVALLLAGTVVSLWRRPAVGFLGAWFFAILAPSSSVVPLVGQAIAEHRMYLPLAAVVVLGVMGIHAVAGRRTIEVAAVLAVGLGFLTVQRNEDYRSGLAIWDDTVAKCPLNPRAHSNLASMLQQDGRMQEAMEHWEQALRLNPDDADDHNNLGDALIRSGRVPEAIEHLEHALRLKPDFAEAHYNLGVALAQAGRIPEAIERWEQALRLKPDYPEAHYNLGTALGQAGKVGEAIVQFEQALRIKPDYAEAHCNLGVALEQAGRPQDAIGHYEQALRLNPDLAEARNALARLQAGR